MARLSALKLMSGIWRQRVGCRAWSNHHIRKIQSDDVLLLEPMRRSRPPRIVTEAMPELFRVLTPRLQPGTVLKRVDGSTIPVGRLIGLSIHDTLIVDSKGREYQVRDPDPAEYILNRPRVRRGDRSARVVNLQNAVKFRLADFQRPVVACIPTESYQDLGAYDHNEHFEDNLRLDTHVSTVSIIRPADAACIVRLLNLDLPARDFSKTGKAHKPLPPLEILEAGSGMGSLTLALAHAIHGLNDPGPPVSLVRSVFRGVFNENFDWQRLSSDPILSPIQCTFGNGGHVNSDMVARCQTYLRSRRVVIISVDREETHQNQARANLRDFRHGKYLLNVDWHGCDLVQYLEHRLAANKNQPFLGHIILDLPTVDSHLWELVAKSLMPGGKVITYCSNAGLMFQYRGVHGNHGLHDCYLSPRGAFQTPTYTSQCGASKLSVRSAGSSGYPSLKHVQLPGTVYHGWSYLDVLEKSRCKKTRIS